MAERVGFEPTVPMNRDNGFQDRRVQPLCHLSAREFKKRTLKKQDALC